VIHWKVCAVELRFMPHAMPVRPVVIAASARSMKAGAVVVEEITAAVNVATAVVGPGMFLWRYRAPVSIAPPEIPNRRPRMPPPEAYPVTQ
jgi:hypothetical protein